MRPPLEHPPEEYPRAPRAAWGGEDHDPYSSYDDSDNLPRSHIAVIVITAVLCSAGTSVGLHFLMRSGTFAASGVAVPELVGLSAEAARAAAEGAGLTLQAMGTTPDPAVPKGAVARQVPLAGQRAERGATIIVTLSQGAEQALLPALAGMALSEALSRLDALGFKVGSTSYRAAPGVPEGHVVTTDPPAGSSLAAGARVSPVLARVGGAEQPAPVAPPPTAPPPATAPPPVQPPPAVPRAGTPGMVVVPKVVGVRLTFATSRLGSVGLAVGSVTYERDEDHMEEFVLRQTPLPGVEAPRGSPVDLVVNRLE